MIFYKYTDGNVRIIESLENGLIRYTQPRYLNDPFEMRPVIQSVMKDGHLTELMKEELKDRDKVQALIIDTYIKMLMSQTIEIRMQSIFVSIKQYFAYSQPNLSSQDLDDVTASTFRKITAKGIDSIEVENFLREGLKNLLTNAQGFYDHLEIFLSDHAKEQALMFLPAIRKSLNEQLMSDIGVLCLSEENDNILMWAHYTKSHKGFVLGFDSRHSFFEKENLDSMQGLKRVTYSEKRPTVPIFDSSSEKLDYEEASHNFLRNFLLTKSIHWKYENEWRMFMPIKGSVPVESDVYLFEFPPDALCEIIIGSQMENALIDRLFNLKSERYPHLQYFKAVPDEAEFKINIDPINL